MRRLLAPLTIALGLAVFSADGRALAQPSPDVRAAAAALFDTGHKLQNDGKFAEACPKLEESQKLDPSMGTLFYLSDCYEKIGRTMSAWVGFREVAAQALIAGAGDREKFARGRVATLEPQLMRLKIVVRPDAGQVSVTRDGAVMSPGVFGTPVPLDPGAHVITATAPGKESWELKIDLKDPGQTLTIEVPTLLDKKGGTAAVTPPGGDKASPPAGPQSTLVAGNPGIVPGPDTEPKRTWQRPVGIAMTGVGALGLGLGTALGFMAKSTFDDSASHCDAAGFCDPTGIEQRKSAVGKGNVATGVFVAGAVVAAGGLVLWITAPSHKAAAPVGVSIGPGSAALVGSF
jgi:serine/threonine-protein kinase